MSFEIDHVELRSAIQKAVNARIAAWDAEHDIELVLGGDEVDTLAEVINNAAVVGSADMNDDQLQQIADAIIEAHAEQYPYTRDNDPS
jgi:hypothetical protein